MSFTKKMAAEAPKFVKRATELLTEGGFSVDEVMRTTDPLYLSSHTGSVYRQIMVEFEISAQRANTAVGRAVRGLRSQQSEPTS